MSRDDVEAARSAETGHSVNTTALREAMLNNLDDEQLQLVAQKIDVAPDQLAGGRGRKVMATLQAAERNGRLADLLAACQKIAPDVDWQKSY